MLANLELAQTVAQDGFAVVPNILDPGEIARLISLLGQADDQTSVRSRGEVYAMRNLLDVVPEVRQLANSPALQALVKQGLGSKAFPVRGILFDKPPEANWKVPWH